MWEPCWNPLPTSSSWTASSGSLSAGRCRSSSVHTTRLPGGVLALLALVVVLVLVQPLGDSRSPLLRPQPRRPRPFRLDLQGLIRARPPPRLLVVAVQQAAIELHQRPSTPHPLLLPACLMSGCWQGYTIRKTIGRSKSLCSHSLSSLLPLQLRRVLHQQPQPIRGLSPLVLSYPHWTLTRQDHVLKPALRRRRHRRRALKLM